MDLIVFAIFVTSEVSDLMLCIFVTSKVSDFIYYMLIHMDSQMKTDTNFLGERGPAFSAYIVFGWYLVLKKVYSYTRNHAMHIILTHDGYE